MATAGSGDEVHRVKAMECAKWQWLTVMKCVGELVPDDDSNDGDGNGCAGELESLSFR